MEENSRHGPLTDEEFGELGKTLGTLIHHVMRARQDNPEAGSIAILSTLAKCGPVRASEIAQTLFLDLSTVSRHVQHLERSGLVEKVADPTDRRAMTLHLTAEGKETVEQYWQRRTELMRDGLSHWDPADLRTLTGLLTRYTDDFAAIIARHPKWNSSTHPSTHSSTQSGPDTSTNPRAEHEPRKTEAP